jgi:hypothetical protein
MAEIFLVSCASTKLQEPARAEDLYVSPLFVKAKKLAQLSADKWFILSAKHMLLDPHRRIKPYDKTLLLMPKEQRRKWANQVARELRSKTSPKDHVVILAGEAYRQYLVPELKEMGYSVQTPVEGLSIGRQLQWLNTKLHEYKLRDDLEAFYKLIDKLKKGLGDKYLLGSCNSKMCWPNRGVYFFFEEGEYRTNAPNVQRVVRVGTHAVSRGAVSTLWGRLRTHKGTPDGLGNHRGSIFRLHVGNALLRQMGGQNKLLTWGKGQAANKDIKREEEWMERQVSDYLGKKMSLLWLNIGDASSALSDRAFIERNAIALISNNKHPVDLPSPTWLGRFSDKEEIRESGLWNIRHVDDAYDPKFINIFSEYVEITLGTKKPLLKSIGPLKKNVNNRKQRSQSRQLDLFMR